MSDFRDMKEFLSTNIAKIAAEQGEQTRLVAKLRSELKVAEEREKVLGKEYKTLHEALAVLAQKYDNYTGELK